MIVIDANILIYSLIEGDYSLLAKQLRVKESDWRTVKLCLHEVLNETFAKLGERDEVQGVCNTGGETYQPDRRASE